MVLGPFGQWRFFYWDHSASHRSLSFHIYRYIAFSWILNRALLLVVIFNFHLIISEFSSLAEIVHQHLRTTTLTPLSLYHRSTCPPTNRSLYWLWRQRGPFYCFVCTLIVIKSVRAINNAQNLYTNKFTDDYMEQFHPSPHFNRYTTQTKV